MSGLTAFAALFLLCSLPASGQLICENDPTRTIFAGGLGSGTSGGACRQFDGNQAICEQAFILGGNGLTSCFYDAGSNECRGCGPNNEADSLCVNECRPTPVCEADPTLVFAGPPFSGQSGGACRQHDGDETACNQSFTLGGNGVASCFYDNGSCFGCGPINERDGDCTNECRPAPVCAGDPTRVFAGPPFSGQNGGACRQHDGNESACNQAFHLGGAGISSCFYDSDGGNCLGCGPNNERDGDCTNVCRTDPGCVQDPSRTIFAGGPGTEACHQFDGDPATCNEAYHQGGDGVVSSCFPIEECVPCGSGDSDLPICVNACQPIPTCLDATRTVFAGGPGNEGCRRYDGDQTTCEKAFLLGGSGVASCFYDTAEDECLGCGPRNRENGDCTNTCIPPVPPPACAGDPTRTTFLGGAGTMACQQAPDQTACEQSFHRTGSGDLASCWWDGGNNACRGCGPDNESDGRCTNECRTAATTCPNDPTRVFAGGPDTNACRQFNGMEAACNGAYHLGGAGYASCFYNAANNTCLGCGPSNEGEDCINTCLPVPPCQDASRTIFTGHPESAGCHRFDGDSVMCLQAYVEGDGGAASCWYDSSEDECRGCGPENANEGNCTNSCQPTPVCTEDTSRTLTECDEFDGDPTACGNAFQLNQEGTPIACQSIPFCFGCGLRNQAEGVCTNTCFAGTGTETGNCDDGIDNDNDNAVDCADAECLGDPACVAQAPLLSPGGLVVVTIVLFALATLALRRQRASY